MRFIMAASLQHAVSSAVTDCEWKQIRQDRFIDQDGEEVRYLSDPDMIRGCAPGTIVYYASHGPRSNSLKGWQEWRRKTAMVEASRAVFKDPPMTERVKEARKAAWEANKRAGYFK